MNYKGPPPVHLWLWRPVHRRCTSHTHLGIAIYVKVNVRTWLKIISRFFLLEIPRLIQYPVIKQLIVFDDICKNTDFSPREFRMFQRRNKHDNHPYGIFKVLFLHSSNYDIRIVRQCHTAKHGFEQSQVFQNDQTHLKNRSSGRPTEHQRAEHFFNPNEQFALPISFRYHHLPLQWRNKQKENFVFVIKRMKCEPLDSYRKNTEMTLLYCIITIK